MGNDLLIPLIIIAGVVGFVKRCDWFKICGDSSSSTSPPPSPPVTAPTTVPSASDTSGLSPDLVKMATTGPGASKKHVTKHKKVAVKRGKRGTRTVVPISSSDSSSSDHIGCLSGAIPATDPRCASSAFTSRISI